MKNFKKNILASVALVGITLVSYSNIAKGENNTDKAVDIGSKLVKHYLPSIGENAPDWAKRIEFDFGFGEKQQPTFTLLTVQPIYQNEKDTVFVQGSQLRYKLAGEMRDTTNIGLGYRRLFNDNQILAGVNTFYDHEWTRNHSRISLGGELKMHVVDFTSNYYWGISNEQKAKNNSKEKALDGFDLELSSQIPYLPWARIAAKHFEWKADKASKDNKGQTYSGIFDLTQNVQLEVGHTIDSYDRNRFEANIRFSLANTKKPVAASSLLFDAKPFEMRDMREHRLDKVRRENRIIVEKRVAGTVTISRR